MAARHSLRVRLPLLISAILVGAVATFLWVAYRDVEAALVRTGSERARGAADQVANLVERSSQLGMETLRRVAADSDVRRHLRNPTDHTREAARARLTPLATTGPRRIELWSAAGSRLLDISIPAAAIPGAVPVVLPVVMRPPAPGLNALQAVDNVVFTDSAAEVLEEPSSATQAATSARLGYVVIRTTFSVNPPGALGRLVGSDAVVEIGNTAGGTWTDLSSIVTAPRVDVTRNGVAEYRAADGERRLGAVSTIRGTPWAVWVEFPRAKFVAPARTFLRRMIVVTLVVVVIGALLTRQATVRVTRPLQELVQAAEDVAGGDYGRRVAGTRRDEIGRVGRAFNAMVADIRDKHQQLETHALEQLVALKALRTSEDDRVQLLVREREARAQAEEANRLKDQFLATLSHELRTPLNAILGYARLLRTNAMPTAKHDHAVEIIERNALAQNQLVDDLLDLSRITTGKMRLDTAPLPIAVPLQEAVESVRPAAEAKHIALELSIDPSAGLVKADASRLQQVFWNLLSNAVKFTNEGGSVSVTLGQDHRGLRTTISDTGVGIAPEFLPYVFDLFRQADGGFSRQHGGLGLGLALCKQLVELHGGTITAASDGRACGATFIVLLPQYAPILRKPRAERRRADVTHAASPGNAIATSAVPLQGLDVLVVDDETDALELVRHLLESAGATVRTVAGGSDALREFDTRPPDLLVTDLGLPGMDGYDVLRRVRARQPKSGGSVPAVALTAYARQDDRTKSLAAGFNDHIAKPIDPEAFVSALVAAVKQRA